MEKIWAPADKVLVEIGRFVLLRPIISAILLLIAITITILTNSANLFNSGHHFKPINPRVFNPIITVNHDNVLNLHPVSNELPKPIQATVQTSTIAKEPSLETSTITPQNLSIVSNQIPSSGLAATAKPAYKSPSNTTWQAFRIHNGDNLVRVFKKYKIDAKDAATFASLSSAKSLRHLKPGQQMLLIIDDQHKLQKLTYGIPDDKDSLTLIRNASDTFDLEKIQLKQPAIADTDSLIPLTNLSADLPVSTNAQNIASTASSLSYISGDVRKSLIIDSRKAGLSAKQANQLAQIFSGQKVQRGDQFSVLFQDGSTKNADENVAIAQLTHSGKLLQLIRFATPKGSVGYYTPNGESLNASILRAPLQYKRISSFFSHSRFHPMLHFFRPHLGVDYAASTGTPIKAAGNGVIAEIERTGGYGNSIVIKHDSKYSTLYAHMSNFASNLHVGSVVQQGQIIGYVGSTGLATGPHLHYEIHVNNVAMNPLTVALPPQSVPSPYRNQFLAQAKILLAQLKSNQSVRLADKGDNIKRS